MKVLVTGATGFIGKYVVEELRKRKVEVIASSRTGGDIPFDLSEFDDAVNYYEYFQQPDCMIHLAWEGLPNYKSSFHIDENLPRHFAFLSNMIRNGLNDLTVTGTCFEYGMQEGQLNEEMSVKPDNPYAVAKNILRMKLQALPNPLTLKWVRLFYMYGKGQNPNSLLSQLDKALEQGEQVFNMSGGEQVRDYLPVEKVAEYIVTVALQKKVTGVINISSNEPVTVKQFVENYLRKKNKTITLNLGHYPYPDYEPMRFWGDNGKLKTILD